MGSPYNVKVPIFPWELIIRPSTLICTVPRTVYRMVVDLRQSYFMCMCNVSFHWQISCQLWESLHQQIKSVRGTCACRSEQWSFCAALSDTVLNWQNEVIAISRPRTILIWRPTSSALGTPTITFALQIRWVEVFLWALYPRETTREP